MKIAHIRKDREGNVCQQSILAHKVGVSTLASDFARCFGAEELARYIGILHDIGKYSEAFQRRINGSAEKVDHSTAGAQEALKIGSDAGVIAAFCIGGHHFVGFFIDTLRCRVLECLSCRIQTGSA